MGCNSHLNAHAMLQGLKIFTTLYNDVHCPSKMTPRALVNITSMYLYKNSRIYGYRSGIEKISTIIELCSPNIVRGYISIIPRALTKYNHNSTLTLTSRMQICMV